MGYGSHGSSVSVVIPGATTAITNPIVDMSFNHGGQLIKITGLKDVIEQYESNVTDPSISITLRGVLNTSTYTVGASATTAPTFVFANGTSRTWSGGSVIADIVETGTGAGQIITTVTIKPRATS